jgi:hypothetical protein
MSTRTLTIDQVEKIFTTWRHNKNGGHTIPDKLWVKVKALINSYGPSPVLKRLGISWKQARNKGLIPTKSACSVLKKRKAPSPFIKIPQAITAHDKRPQLSFQRGEAQLILNDPSNEQIQLFIDMLKMVN